MRQDELVRPVPVKTGLTDGFVTEIITDELPEGAEVIVGQVQSSGESEVESKNDGEPTLPFLPKIKNGKAKR